MDKPENARKDPTEGVRIIGAEEAAEALERDDIARRRQPGTPRYGDRPETPPEDGPRPAIRFPLSGRGDPTAVERPSVVPPDPPVSRPVSGEVSMPHWTEPPTGEVPRVLSSNEPGGDDLDAWSTFTSSQPRWRGEGSTHEREEFDDFSRLADDETRVGALDPNRPAPDDFFTFEDYEQEPDDAFEPAPVGARSISSDPRRSRSRAGGAGYERPPGAGRNVQQAVAVGVGFAVLALVLFKAGPRYAMVLVTAVLVLAALEFFNALRRGGHHPATLLGLASTASMVLASYWKGEAAIPLVLFLTIAFGLIWYLAGAGGRDRPVEGLGATLLGVCYVGVLGSFAALILGLPNGIGILLGGLVATVGYDLGGFIIGRNAGRQPLSAASPNKTVEGLVGGMICAVFGAVIVFALGIHPWDESFSDVVKLGIAVAIAAPLGDLCESLLKRDLGVKDMAETLPGHGGFLDRFDALLFVLPATYYMARILLF